MYNGFTPQKTISLMLIADPDIAAEAIFSQIKPQMLEGIDRKVYEQCYQLFKNGNEIDLININDPEINDHVMEYAALGSLTEVHVERAINRVKNENDYLKLGGLSVAIKSMAKSKIPIDQIWAMMDDAREKMTERKNSAIKSIGELVAEHGNEKSFEKMTVSHIKTGWPDFDRRVIVKPDDLIVIAGRPSMGKTDFALQLIKKAALNGHRPFMFSLEMRANYLLRRLAGGEGVTDYLDGCQRLKNLPIHFDDCHSQSIFTIKRQLKTGIERFGSDIVVIDYLSLLDTERGENRNREIEELTKSLKQIAREYGIPIFLIVQLNRDVEKRKDKMPMLSDLRDSGGIEQNIDIAMFLWYPKHYQIDYLEKKIHGSDVINTENYLQLILGKQRDGATGFLEFHYNRAKKIIENWGKI